MHMNKTIRSSAAAPRQGATARTFVPTSQLKRPELPQTEWQSWPFILLMMAGVLTILLTLN